MRYAILHGTICGPIWQPGFICARRVTARIERSDATTFVTGGPYPSLRDAMIALMNDGDFRACGFVPGETWLEVVDEHYSNSSTRYLHKRTRAREIAFACPDTEDMRADARWVDEYETRGGDDD